MHGINTALQHTLLHMLQLLVWQLSEHYSWLLAPEEWHAQWVLAYLQSRLTMYKPMVTESVTRPQGKEFRVCIPSTHSLLVLLVSKLRGLNEIYLGLFSTMSTTVSSLASIVDRVGWLSSARSFMCCTLIWCSLHFVFSITRTQTKLLLATLAAFTPSCHLEWKDNQKWAVWVVARIPP